MVSNLMLQPCSPRPHTCMGQSIVLTHHSLQVLGLTPLAFLQESGTSQLTDIALRELNPN